MAKPRVKKHFRTPAFDDDYEFNCRYCGYGLDASKAGQPAQAQTTYVISESSPAAVAGGFEAEGFEADGFEVETPAPYTLMVDVGGISIGCPFCHSPNWAGARTAGSMRRGR